MSDNKKQISRPLIDRAHFYSRKHSGDQVSTIISKRIDPSLQLKGLRFMTKDIEEQNVLGVALVEWTCSPDSYYIEKFPISRGISPFRFFKVKATNEFFAECVELANSICHLNLKQAIHAGELHHTYVLAMLPVFDGDYRGYMMDKVAKKVAEYIKSQQAFTCSWLNDLNKESTNESRTETDQPVPTETLPEEIS